MADNSTLPATADVIRDKDRAGIKTQIIGRDLNIGGATEVLETAAALTDSMANPTVPPAASMLAGWTGSVWERIKSIGGAIFVYFTDVTASGSLTTGQAITLTLSGHASASFQIPALTGTINFQISNDGGTTWDVANAVASSTSAPATSTTVPGFYRLTPGGVGMVRALLTGTSATVNGRASYGGGGVYANQILPTKNTNGTDSQAIKAASTAAVAADAAAVVALSPNSNAVTNSGTFAVQAAGVFWQATQPVSVASLPLPAGAATDGTDITTPTAMPAGGVGMRGWLSAIWTKLNGSLAVTGAFFQATQPVSLATNTPDVTDRAARLLGQVTNAGTFAVQAAATLSAETTKVIGTINIAAAQTLAATQSAIWTVQPGNTANSTPWLINAAQIGGVAPLMGNGVTGTGSQRLTLASDNSALPAAGQGAVGSAVPAGATLPGLRATTANPANATAGNMVAAMGDKAGRAVVAVGQVRELIGVQQTSVAVVTADQPIVTAGGAGVFNDISQLIITTTGAAAQTITIKDAAAGTTRLVLNYPNAAVAPGAPLTINFSPPLVQAAANAAWVVTQSAATACNYTVVFAKNL